MWALLGLVLLIPLLGCAKKKPPPPPKTTTVKKAVVFGQSKMAPAPGPPPEKKEEEKKEEEKKEEEKKEEEKKEEKKEEEKKEEEKKEPEKKEAEKKEEKKADAEPEKKEEEQKPPEAPPKDNPNMVENPVVSFVTDSFPTDPNAEAEKEQKEAEEKAKEEEEKKKKAADKKEGGDDSKKEEKKAEEPPKKEEKEPDKNSEKGKSPGGKSKRETASSKEKDKKKEESQRKSAKKSKAEGTSKKVPWITVTGRFACFPFFGGSDRRMSSTLSPKMSRKIEESFPSPASKKIKEEHSDEGEAGSEGQADLENGPTYSDGDLVPISYLQQHLQPMIDYVPSTKKGAHSAKGFKKVAAEYFKTQKGIDDPEKWGKCMDHYLRIALRHSNLSIGQCCDVLHNYMQRGDTVRQYPDWPKRPLNLVRTYAKNNGIKLGFLTGMNETIAAMNIDSVGRDAATSEVLAATLNYVEELKEFRRLHHDLSKEQLEFIQKTLSQYEKAVKKEEPKGTPVKKKSSPKPKPLFETPFAAFCHGSRDLYIDLEPEKRLKKLTKKFNKLSDAELDLYQRLAA
ncbi:unnamed protein product, partial [Mesorhabditis spiculigera]